MRTRIERAAAAVEGADVVIVSAGAGIGVDSGLPDFRGDDGFWRAYPPYRKLGRSFVDMANPAAFHRDPAFAWGFYGHRRALYRRTRPHEGFHVLRRWVEEAPLGGFVVTSNVDGQFQAAGFDADAIWEVHGTIHVDQCLHRCGQPPFAAGPDVDVDPETMRARPPLPACPACGGPARPNILMFGDGEYDPVLADAQQRRFHDLLADAAGHPTVVVEVGAGTAVPTIRRIDEQLQTRNGATLVRVNPREPGGPADTIELALGGRDGLLGIDAARA